MSKAVTHSPWRLFYPSSCRSTNQHEPHDTPWGLCSLSSSYEHRCQLTGPRCVKVPTAARVRVFQKRKRRATPPGRYDAAPSKKDIWGTMFKVSTKREEGVSEDMRGLNRTTSKRLNRSKTLKWSTSKRLRRNT
ncbi:hypothetical protein Bbelb_286110 [Branchiostoma belcheri]|nr:hypothetical protein Bbelb_286110 [Branchiostoma belcheri]